MTRRDSIRAALAFAIIVLGCLQGWDSGAYTAGLLVVTLVSTAIALPAVAIQAPLKGSYLIGAILASFLLLLIARLASPVPLPGLFLILLPSAIGLVYEGIVVGKRGTTGSSPSL